MENHLKRLSVSLTAQELRAVESKATRLDKEIEVAMRNLSQNLESNKNLNNVSYFPCSAQHESDLCDFSDPTPSDAGLDFEIFSDLA